MRGSGRRLDLERRLVLVKALLAHGADPNARIAASAIAYVQGYLRNGAYDLFAVGLGDVAGATPLAVAAYSMNTAGIFPGVRDYRVDSSPAILRALLQAGADPGLRTKDESTPLMMLVGCGRFTYNPGARRSHPSPSTDEAAKVMVEEGPLSRPSGFQTPAVSSRSVTTAAPPQPGFDNDASDSASPEHAAVPNDSEVGRLRITFID